MRRTLKVIIVGVGISGLAAARQLVESKSFQVTVLEGKDHIGGRTHSIPFGKDINIDVGAVWIHGIEGGNPLYNLVWKHQINVFQSHKAYNDQLENSCFFDGKGETLSLQEVSQAREYVYSSLNQAIQSQCQQLSGDHSVEHALLEQMQKSPQSALEEVNRELINWSITRVEQYSGGRLSELSTQHWNDYEDFPGGHVCFPKTGYSVITKLLADGLDVRLNSKVTEINYQAKDFNIKVHIETGEVMEADLVVITVPLGVLKQSVVNPSQSAVIRFVPPLPEAKVQAISRLGFGVVNKVILKFAEPFWPQDKDFLGFCSEIREEFYFAFNILKHTGVPIIMFFNGIEFSNQIEEESDEAIISRVMQKLKLCFKSTSQLEAYHITRWRSDQYSRGSYTFLPVGSSNADILTLSQPLEERIFFAGEHTHEKCFSTTNGAFLSGIRAAQFCMATERE